MPLGSPRGGCADGVWSRPQDQGEAVESIYAEEPNVARDFPEDLKTILPRFRMVLVSSPTSYSLRNARGLAACQTRKTKIRTVGWVPSTYTRCSVATDIHALRVFSDSFDKALSRLPINVKDGFASDQSSYRYSKGGSQSAVEGVSGMPIALGTNFIRKCVANSRRLFFEKCIRTSSSSAMLETPT